MDEGALMGTGSFGNGGSGALGRSGSGAATRFRSATSTEAKGGDFFGWRSKSGAAPSPVLAGQLLRETFAQRNVARFVAGIVTSPQVRGCYEDLFRLSVLLVQQRSWDAIQREYGVPGTPGCLAELHDALVQKHAIGGTEPQREIAGAATLDFLLAAIGNNDELFLTGDAKAIFAAIKPAVFKSLSGHFVGSVVNRAAERELPPLQEEESLIMRPAVQQRTDFIIHAFERAWLNTQSDGRQVTHRQFLEVAADKGDWLEGKLREEIPQ
jgi:hypothetical protein